MSFKFVGKVPNGFVISKPIAQEGYKEPLLYELDAEGRLIKTRKRDGWKGLIATTKTNVINIYTDSANAMDRRMEHVRDDIRSLGLPPNTLLIGEMLIDINGADDIGKTISVFQSSEERSIALQKEIGMVKFMIFGLVFLDGKAVEMPYKESLAYIQDIICRANPKHILNMPVLDVSFDQAKKMVTEHGWEGLVLYEHDFVYTFRLDGKNPKRPKGCYKWKPIFEDDFIVREKIMRPDGAVVKEVVLLQIDPKTRTEFSCGKLGSFTGELRETLSKDSSYPLVMQVAFEMRFPKSGKVRNAKFLRIRKDKKIKDCVAPKSYSSGV